MPLSESLASLTKTANIAAFKKAPLPVKILVIAVPFLLAILALYVIMPSKEPTATAATQAQPAASDLTLPPIPPTEEPTSTPPPTPTTAPPPTSTPEPPPTEQRRPDATGQPPDFATICKRTPEVQRAIIMQLADIGPRMSCKAITEEELFRLRTLNINETLLAPGDLNALPNLRELNLTVKGRIHIKAFSGLTNLDTLSIDYTKSSVTSLFPGLFKDLHSLSRLTIKVNPEARFRLDRHIISGLNNLQFFDISDIDSIASDTFYDTKTLKNLTIKSFQDAEASIPLLPERLFQTSPNLTDVQVTNFRIPPLLNLASPQAACYATSNEEPQKTGWAGHAQLTFNAKPLELLEWTPHEDGTSTCRLIVNNDRIAEVTIPHH